MEILNQLNQKIEALIQKLEKLELENMELSEELSKEKQAKEQVLASIDGLLNRIQEVNVD